MVRFLKARGKQGGGKHQASPGAKEYSYKAGKEGRDEPARGSKDHRDEVIRGRHGGEGQGQHVGRGSVLISGCELTLRSPAWRNTA